MGVKIIPAQLGLNHYSYLVRSVSKSEILIQLNIQISNIFLTVFCQLYCFINLKYTYLHIFPLIFHHTLDLYNPGTGFIYLAKMNFLFCYTEKNKNVYQFNFCYIYK